MTEFSPALPSTELCRPPLAQAVRFCRDLTRHHSKTFYLGSRLFSPPERAAVWAVYAACRAGDDIVDEAGSGDSGRELREWRGRIDAAFAGHPADDPISRALAWAVAHYPIPHSAFAELHEGLNMDLRGHEYRELDDLLLYCRRVAGVVGFMVAPISGYRGGAETLHYALQLGQAMQLTNVLRDVGEDLGRGRVYLPQSLLAEYGLSRAALERCRQGEPLGPGYRALMRHLGDLAREGYAEGRAGIPRLEGRGPLAVLTAARAYEGILDDLERGGYDNFGRRAYVSGRRKLLMLPQAWWELRTLDAAHG
ncbi:phytoene/squalene synthase family protein [Deinococcus wulumuqiensis]|uniref:phytoene/squalene synthase family protein n=1 Tax=Deinococcus wulumuqiensis TaxID=980427 RepID=UPI00242A3F83|nr:phytoene/squalene synthase family protein [Deinococcus wulumuqiensis]